MFHAKVILICVTSFLMTPFTTSFHGKNSGQFKNNIFSLVHFLDLNYLRFEGDKIGLEIELTVKKGYPRIRKSSNIIT